MRSLEIFSGAGGLAKGLELAGFEHASFVEFNKDACASLRQNFKSETVFHGDIAEYDLHQLSNIDIVAGGPPCQPFSLGGKHKANEDSRDMFPYAIKAIEVLEPKAFFFENVKGLLRQTFAEYFEYIILRLTFPHEKILVDESWENHLNRLAKIDARQYKGLRYTVSYKLVNAADYGVPQKRERVVIIGTRSDLNIDWQHPNPLHSEDRLNWDKYVTGEYWLKHNIPAKNNHSVRIHLENKYGIFPPEALPWKTVRDALQGVPCPKSNHGINDHVLRAGARSYPGHTGSDIDQPAKTIKAGGHGVPGGENMIRYEDGTVRYFTVYEAKLIQTFPKNFVVTGAWGEALRQIGNAVPVTLSKAIGEQLFHTMSTHTCKQVWA
jgi:DNA (cytosine-5)-methyltransferase 1